MTKLKHNKKRNTAFLYETLVRELTKSIVKKNNIRSSKCFLKNGFKKKKINFKKHYILKKINLKKDEYFEFKKYTK